MTGKTKEIVDKPENITKEENDDKG